MNVTKRHFDFYGILLKQPDCGHIAYDRNKNDYQEGTIVCMAIGQIIGAVCYIIAYTIISHLTSRYNPLVFPILNNQKCRYQLFIGLVTA